MDYFMRNLSCVLIALWIMLSIGCSGIKERIEENSDLFYSYPVEVQEKISKGQVDVGFDKMQVYIAMGDPVSKTKETKGVDSTGEQGVPLADYYIEYEKWTYSGSKRCTYKKRMNNSEWAREYMAALERYERRHRPEKGHKYEKRWEKYFDVLENFEIDDYEESKKKRDRIIRCKGRGCPPVFEPPSEYVEESYWRDYVWKYLYFYEGYLSRQEVPKKTIWLEPEKKDDDL